MARGRCLVFKSWGVAPPPAVLDVVVSGPQYSTWGEGGLQLSWHSPMSKTCYYVHGDLNACMEGWGKLTKTYV